MVDAQGFRIRGDEVGVTLSLGWLGLFLGLTHLLLCDWD